MKTPESLWLSNKLLKAKDHYNKKTFSVGELVDLWRYQFFFE